MSASNESVPGPCVLAAPTTELGQYASGHYDLIATDIAVCPHLNEQQRSSIDAVLRALLLVHSLAGSLILLLAASLALSLTRLRVASLADSLALLLVASLTHWLTHWLLLVASLTHWLSHLLPHSLALLLVASLTH